MYVSGRGVSIYMSMNVFALPVCVPHPKQDEKTAHSGAPKAAEPALIHINTHKCIHVHKHPTKVKERHSLKNHHSSGTSRTFTANEEHYLAVCSFFLSFPHMCNHIITTLPTGLKWVSKCVFTGIQLLTQVAPEAV